MSRSASSRGLEKAQKALENIFHTKEAFATHLSLSGIASRTTMFKFFGRREIKHESFVNICNELKLDWKDIAEGYEPDVLDCYVKRPAIEEYCYETILKPAGLLRIKAPQGMGKTRLASKILVRLGNLGYRTAHLHLDQAEQVHFQSFDKFLQWFCLFVDKRLEKKLDDYWNKGASSSKFKCTTYFEEYLLAQDSGNLVLCLDNLDKIFQYVDLAKDFCGLLRAWNESAFHEPIWNNLRLIVVYSTDEIPFSIIESPFNIGVVIKLEEFTQKEVEELAKCNQLKWSSAQIKQLMELVGGHPKLVCQAFDYLRYSQDKSLQYFVQTAPTEAGIYERHLRELWVKIEQDRRLAEALKTVVTTTEFVRLESVDANKLDSMGLLRRHRNKVTVRCDLYRQYFRDRFGVTR